VLNDHEKHEIDKEIAKFPKKRHACLDALMAVQKSRGYISDETLEEVAHYLDMSTAELDGIATFYNLIFRKPVGDHVIRLCDSVSCWIMGYETVQDAMKKRLGISFGETSCDLRFTLLPAQCLGACDKAPVMMINDALYTNVNDASLSDILQSIPEQGTSYDKASHPAHETGSKTALSKRLSLPTRV
jgi:NADH-quinone oxidoreductase subunit E